MAKKGKLVSSKSKKAYWTSYPTKYIKHRKAKLERHILENPEDKQAEKALAEGRFEYRRNNRVHTAPKPRHASEEVRALRIKMQEIHVKHGLPKVSEPEYIQVLREFAETLKPKVRYKRGKKIEEIS